MRSIVGLASMAVLAGMAAMHTPLHLEPPAPQPAPDPEPAKKARRVAAKMTARRMRLQFGDEMPPLDNHAAKLMGLPHQGSREMARRVGHLLGAAEKSNGRP